MSAETHVSPSVSSSSISESFFEEKDSHQPLGNYHDVEALSDGNEGYPLQGIPHTPPRRISPWIMSEYLTREQDLSATVADDTLHRPVRRCQYRYG